MDRIRMQFGGLDRGTFVLYLSDKAQDDLGETRWTKLHEMLDTFDKTFAGHFLAIEGARCLGTDPIGGLSSLGIANLKYVTMVHNKGNILCSSSSDLVDTGLSKQGLEFMRFLEKVNVLVDVSHASDRATDSILHHATRPVIASHSGVRPLVKSSRNLLVTQIRAIAGTGGMVCVPFAKKFVWNRAGVVQHIDFICQLLGECSHVGIGSDLDGAQMVDGVKGAEDWGGVVLQGLSDGGFADSEIARIAGGNLLKLYGDAA